MSENSSENSKRKKLTFIRSVICIIVIIVIALGMFEIIPQVISLIASCILLTVVAIWNGAVIFKSGKKSMAVFNFILAAAIITICIAFIVKQVRQ